jgi:hypothetical protein
MKQFLKYSFCFLLFFQSISCKKMIEVNSPKTELTPETTFSDDQTVIAVLSNMYAQFNGLIDASVSPPIGTYSDELSTTSSNSVDIEYYDGKVSVTNSTNLNCWQSFYSVIYQCNSILENIDGSPNITPAVKQQVKGEALFLRSVSYFYLLNLYGDVPLLLTTDVDVTSVAERTPLMKIYNQIVNDLVQAKDILSEQYPSDDRVRANKWAASALLARVYLYQENWSNAESEANAVISSGYYVLDTLSDVFKSDSKESILQFWTKEQFCNVALLFIPDNGSIPTYPLTETLINSFEKGDLRKAEWIDSVEQGNTVFYFPYKYKYRSTSTAGSGEYLMFLRLGEQYLIRAEARAHQNKTNQSNDDLNIIRKRAGLPNVVENDSTSLLSAIQHERRIELFSEWGHRFFDLKRTGEINQVMSAVKPGWKDASSLLPIPQYEILNNPNLNQNPGY